MFDEISRLAQQGTQQFTVQMEIHSDADGYVDKECPNPECQFGFKIHEEDWKAIVRDEEVFCPACGHTAKAESWYTTEQVEWAQQNAVNQLMGQLGAAMERDAAAFNRRQPRNSFITMKMQVKGGSEPVQLPLTSTDPMRLKMTCGQCQCRYSVIGSAYFCPSCGHSAVDQVFSQSLDKIRAALDLAPSMRSSIPDRYTAENTIRVLIESGLQGAVTAFQRVVEALYALHPSAAKARRNVFKISTRAVSSGRELTAKPTTYISPHSSLSGSSVTSNNAICWRTATAWWTPSMSQRAVIAATAKASASWSRTLPFASVSISSTSL